MLVRLQSNQIKTFLWKHAVGLELPKHAVVPVTAVKVVPAVWEVGKARSQIDPPYRSQLQDLQMDLNVLSSLARAVRESSLRLSRTSHSNPSTSMYRTSGGPNLADKSSIVTTSTK